MTKIVVNIPAYNEEKTIGAVIKAIPRNCAKEVKVLVIDDGSKDNTIKVSKEASADRIIAHKTNLRLGRTFRDGINEALKMGADIIVNIDADGQFNPLDIPRLIQPILDNKADMVTCSRFKDKKLIPEMPFFKKIGNYFFAALLSLFLKKKYYDTQCGFRAYSREAAMNLVLFGKFTYTQEVFIDLVKKGFRIKEVPCVVRGQRNGKSRVVKNIFDYGLNALLIIIRCARDYEPFQFFGLPGVALLSIGILSNFILFIRWLMTSKFDPFLMLIYLNTFFIIVGALLIVLGLVADMLGRNRQLQEEILYKLKKKEIEETKIKN